MTKQELQNKLNELCSLPAETKWLEFKAARTNFTFKELGQYFSALSNEACLKNKGWGFL
jgi:ATP-dependent DNA helicase RecG